MNKRFVTRYARGNHRNYFGDVADITFSDVNGRRQAILRITRDGFEKAGLVEDIDIIEALEKIDARRRASLAPVQVYLGGFIDRSTRQYYVTSVSLQEKCPSTGRMVSTDKYGASFARLYRAMR